MPPASNEEQFKFLISCIRYSNNGKVDFGEVAKECSIVSKGAAAKRYERMMKSHGIAPNAASVRNSSASKASPQKEKSDTGSSHKKRKAEQFNSDAAEDDPEPEDYGYGNNGGITNIKRELANDRESLQAVKQEPGQYQPHQHIENGRNIMQLPFHLENGEDIYTARSSTYGPSSGYNTPVDNGTVYGHRNQRPFLSVAEYPQVKGKQAGVQQSGIGYADTSAQEEGSYEHESILIHD